MYDNIPNICLTCLEAEGMMESTLVFNEVNYGAGRRAPTKAMRRTANRREGQLAKDIGGRQQPMSGALPHAKGDVRRVGEWVGDDKTCRTKGFRITLELIGKVRSWCKRREKFFVTIGFLHPVTGRVEDEVVVIDRHVFEGFVNADVDR